MKSAAASTLQARAGKHNWDTRVVDHTAQRPNRVCQGEGPTVVDDAVLKQSLTQVDAFLRVPRLANLHKPGHELAARWQKKGKTNLKIHSEQLFTELNGTGMLWKKKKICLLHC